MRYSGTDGMCQLMLLMALWCTRGWAIRVRRAAEGDVADVNMDATTQLSDSYAHKLSETLGSMVHEEEAGQLNLVSESEADEVLKSILSEVGSLSANVSEVVSLLMADTTSATLLRHMTRMGLSLGDDAELKELIQQLEGQTFRCDADDTSTCVVDSALASVLALTSVAKHKFISSSASFLQTMGPSSFQALMDFIQGDRICALKPNEMLADKLWFSWFYCYAADVSIDLFISRIGPKGIVQLFLGPMWYKLGIYGSYVSARFNVRDDHPTLHTIDLMVAPNWAYFMGGPLDLAVKVFLSFKDRDEDEDAGPAGNNMGKRRGTEAGQVTNTWNFNPRKLLGDSGIWTRTYFDSGYYRAGGGRAFAHRDGLEWDTDFGLLETYNSFMNKTFNMQRFHGRTTLRIDRNTSLPWRPYKIIMDYPPIAYGRSPRIAKDMAFGMHWLTPGWGS